FSPSLFGSRRGFCSEAGRAGALFQSFLHKFPCSDILFESFPCGGQLSFDFLVSRALDDDDLLFSGSSYSSQSPGECHRIKSSKIASGFAALNADISSNKAIIGLSHHILLY
ncbi:hypothetical protein V8G54_034319, partial [Vigna mungo]